MERNACHPFLTCLLIDHAAFTLSHQVTGNLELLLRRLEANEAEHCNLIPSYHKTDTDRRAASVHKPSIQAQQGIASNGKAHTRGMPGLGDSTRVKSLLNTAHSAPAAQSEQQLPATSPSAAVAKEGHGVMPPSAAVARGSPSTSSSQSVVDLLLEPPVAPNSAHPPSGVAFAGKAAVQDSREQPSCVCGCIIS
jgi:hypothetical protein